MIFLLLDMTKIKSKCHVDVVVELFKVGRMGNVMRLGLAQHQQLL